MVLALNRGHYSPNTPFFGTANGGPDSRSGFNQRIKSFCYRNWQGALAMVWFVFQASEMPVYNFFRVLSD
jgi:hypothetical protein